MVEMVGQWDGDWVVGNPVTLASFNIDSVVAFMDVS